MHDLIYIIAPFAITSSLCSPPALGTLTRILSFCLGSAAAVSLLTHLRRLGQWCRARLGQAYRFARQRTHVARKYDPIAATYYPIEAGLNGDVAFYVEEARQSRTPVLELGCGTGRMLVPLVEAGIDVVGLEISPLMLDVARQKVAQLSPETQARATLIAGDMRDFALAQRFDRIIIPFRAFNHLPTVADQRRALACIHAHLTPGGCLVFDLLNPQHDESRDGAERCTRAWSTYRLPGTGRTVTLRSTLTVDHATQLMTDERTYDDRDEQGHLVTHTLTSIAWRSIYRYEMEHLLELCGFQVLALYGDFQRGPFTQEGEQIWVCRKRGDSETAVR